MQCDKCSAELDPATNACPHCVAATPGVVLIPPSAPTPPPPPMPAPQQSRVNGLRTAALVLGLCAPLTFGLSGVAFLVVCAIALAKQKELDPATRSLAIVGLVVVGVILILYGIGLFALFANFRVYVPS